MVLENSWLVCLPSWVGGLLSSGSKLMERTRDWKTTTTKTGQSFCVVFFDMILSCKKLPFLHASEWQKASNATIKWHRQWTTTDLISCDPHWPSICQNWYVLTTNFTLQCQRDWEWERDCLNLQPLTKMHSVAQICFLQIVIALGLSSCLRRGVYFA